MILWDTLLFDGDFHCSLIFKEMNSYQSSFQYFFALIEGFQISWIDKIETSLYITLTKSWIDKIETSLYTTLTN